MHQKITQGKSNNTHELTINLALISRANVFLLGKLFDDGFWTNAFLKLPSNLGKRVEIVGAIRYIDRSLSFQCKSSKALNFP